MASYFLGPNNTKYVVPSQTLKNPCTLSNIIHNGFAPVKVLYEISETKIFSHDFSSNKILSKSKFSSCIMSSE